MLNVFNMFANHIPDIWNWLTTIRTLLHPKEDRIGECAIQLHYESDQKKRRAGP